MDENSRKYRIRYRDGTQGVMYWSQIEFVEAFQDLGSPIPELAVGEEAKDDDLDTWIRVE